ncbi:beta-glucuronidase [Candidatus Moduliflexus flocculans]|uniref:Beta-glucuronidase n=1 Tax=Candidatus Moduliflexus flocculans TaxID=1499966 RepID=A0A0S6VPC6_9BACT|nr:beta-glucuronidase [Candidatus Moduliflexus flocculans]
MKKIISFGMFGLFCCTVGAWFALFRVYPRYDIPAVAQIRGEHFEVRSADNIPYLWSYGLPYPTDVDSSQRQRQSLNGVWWMRLDPDDSGENEGWQSLRQANAQWQDISVPSTFNAVGSPLRHYEGITWFFRTFSLETPPERTEFIRLCFEGVLLRSSVWLNGQLLGRREGGYTPFYFNIAGLLVPGENTLVVKSDNRLTDASLPPKTREGHHPAWWPYGGIYRDVYLETLPMHYLFKVITTPHLDREVTRLDVVALTHNLVKQPRSYALICELRDPDGAIVGQQTISKTANIPIAVHRFEFQISAPRRWSDRSPELYTVALTLHDNGESESPLPDDAIEIKTGLRTIATAQNAFLLNDRSTFLRGISKMEDDPAAGATQTDAIIRRDLTLIRDMNANFIRLAHYPHNVNELRQARDMGIMLGGEIGFYHVGIGWVHWFLEDRNPLNFPVKQFGMKHLHDAALLQNAQRELIEMIERDRNNPAVILWILSNESFSFQRASEPIYAHLRDVAKTFDPTRPVTGTELIYSLAWVDRFRHSAPAFDVLGLNAYFGWYYGKPEDAASHIASYHAQHPGKPILVTEFGAEAALGRTDADGEWRAERVSGGKTYSEEYQEHVIATYLDTFVETPYIAGLVPWVFADFSSDWFPSNPTPYHNCKGLVTTDRRPKQAYFTLQNAYRKLASKDRTGF